MGVDLAKWESKKLTRMRLRQFLFNKLLTVSVYSVSAFSAFLACHSLGERPVTALKLRKKVDSLVKPDWVMTADSFMSGCLLMSCWA